MLQWDFLKRSFELGKISHAYIFFGNDSEKQKKVVADFIAFAKIQSPDVRLVNLEQAEITIKQIRELSAFTNLGAWASPFKIVVIQNAEKANQEAQSALLKVLEEPKGDTIFFLLTPYFFRILPTLRSRAQALGFWRYESIASDLVKDFEKLQTQTLAERFEYAKKLIDSEANVEEVLQQWLYVMRTFLLKSLRENPQKIPSLMQSISATQEILSLLQTTNVNPRLAVEQILLEL